LRERVRTATVRYLGAWTAGGFTVLIVTIAGGGLFGTIGLVLAAR
jgi:hypothetical protein